MQDKIKPSGNIVNILKNIIELGKTKKEVVIKNIKFSLSSLTEKQSSDLFSNIMVLEESMRLIYTKSYAVAASIVSIDDVDFEVLINSYENMPEEISNNLFMKKVYIISLLQTEIVNKLFEEYNALNNQILEVGKEEVKKS